jgi:hypothetical protein
LVTSPPGFEAVQPSGRLAQLLDYWQQLEPGGLPRRTDIDLMEMNPVLLPHVFLVDVLEDSQRFRWRLIGKHIIRNAASDDTGLDLEVSIAPSMRPTIIGHYQQVVRERRPLCHRGEFIGQDGRVYSYERLLLPVLAADGRAVDTVLGGAVFEAERHTLT